MVTIYSKADCPRCINAKALIEAYDIEVDVVKIDEDQVAMDFVLGEGHKAVPQIYIDNAYIGGFKELAGMTKEQFLDKVTNEN